MNIIVFDIDDCLIDCNEFPKEHKLKQFELNLERISYIIEKTNSKLFMISSWSNILKIENNILKFIDDYKPRSFDENYRYECLILHLLNTRIIEKYGIIGLSKGNREEDIKKLLKEGNKVVTIDDYEFKIDNKNHKYIPTYGFIQNYQIRDIINFLKGVI